MKAACPPLTNMAFPHMAFSPGYSRLHIISYHLCTHPFSVHVPYSSASPPSKLDTSTYTSHRSPSASACPVLTKPNPNQLHHQPPRHVPVSQTTLFSTVVLHSTSDLRSLPPKKANTDHIHANHRPSPNATIDTRALSHAMLQESPPSPQVYRLFKKGKRGERQFRCCPFFSLPTLLNQREPCPWFPARYQWPKTTFPHVGFEL